jgi:enediyne biosynthesis protein E5
LLHVPFSSEVAPLTGPMYQLLCFFMLTDPPTTPGTVKRRVISTVIIAALECAFRLANDWHWPGALLVAPAPPIIALFLVGPVTLALDLRSRRR